MERKVIVIVGPTCSGKTDVAIQLAENLNGEIISADSRQIYKLLDIGTAKPTKLQLEKVKHHFIGELDLEEIYDASKFEVDALKIIHEIFSQKKTPIVVGGSGLYIKALVDGIINSVATDKEYRQYLYSIREKFGNEKLYQELIKVDEKSARQMLPQNWKRVIRALEVFHLTGKSILDIQNEHSRKVDYNFIQFGIRWNRDDLYKNINKRVDTMIAQGLIDEVKNILSAGYDKNLYSLNTVGYKEIIDYFEGKHTIETAIELIKRNTRRYAKKQFTWFNADKRIIWVDVINDFQLNEIVKRIENIYSLQ